MQNGEYEFSAEQEESIEKLAQSMGFVGGFMVFMALLGIAGTAFMVYRLLPLLQNPEVSAEFFQAVVLPLLVPALNVLILLIFGILTRGAAGYFRLIADTEGRDIEHLMKAITRLRSAYGLQYSLIMVGIILSVIALIAAFVLAFVV